MRTILILMAMLMLTACGGLGNPESLIDQFKLEDGEHGSVCARATVASPNPMSRSQVAFVYKEYPEGEAAPEC